jgi:hypothetical protein
VHIRFVFRVDSGVAVDFVESLLDCGTIVAVLWIGSWRLITMFRYQTWLDLWIIFARSAG